MQFERLGHVFLVASEVERAKAFYVDVLGFEIIEEDAEHGGVFVALKDGGHAVDLVGICREAPPQARGIEAILPRHGVGHMPSKGRTRLRSMQRLRS